MRLIFAWLAPDWPGPLGELQQFPGVVGGLQDARDDRWLIMRDACRCDLGGADGVLEAIDAGEVSDALAEGGVLDASAVE